MLKMNLQLFAHKKGMGSTKNGRAQRVECALFPVYIIRSLKHQQICVPD